MTQIEVILLSLLCDKNYYGYEFETVIEQRNMRGRTNVGFSSIYNFLNKLEKNGQLNKALINHKENLIIRKKFYF